MLTVGLNQINQFGFCDVSQLVFGFNEMVTGKQIAIVFKKERLAAGLAKNTKATLVANPFTQGDIKNLDEHLANVPFDPFVKYLVQEPAILHTRHGAAGHFIADLIAGLVVSFHNGDELDESGVKIIEQITVDLQWVIGIGGMDRAEHVVLHLVLFQQSQSCQDTIRAALASPILAINVVQIWRPVEADPDQEVIFLEERTPFIREERSVSLDGVFNPHPR